MSSEDETRDEMHPDVDRSSRRFAFKVSYSAHAAASSVIYNQIPTKSATDVRRLLYEIPRGAMNIQLTFSSLTNGVPLPVLDQSP